MKPALLARRGFLTLLLLLGAKGEAAGRNPRISVSRPVFLTPREQAQNFRSGHVLAKVKAGVDRGALRAYEGAVGALMERDYPNLPGLEVLRFDSGRPVKMEMSRLMASGLYEFVEPDWIVRASVIPNDPYFPDQWSLNNTGQNSGTPGADIKAEAGWALQDSASNVVVAVIDSGIRVTHVDLAANIWKNPSPGTGGYVGDLNGINATFPQSEPGNGNPNDDFFHGTMVAGIIGAVGNNAAGLAGVAWNVQLMALKFIAADGFGSGSGEIACIDYAIAHHAQIINGSFGNDEGSQAEFYALQQAQTAGIVVVVAAGNDSLNADAGYAFPAGYLLDNLVTVAATSETDALSSYSNFGAGTVDLAAPGDDITSTFNTSDSDYATGSGTSFAAPHVAGSLALLKAHFPNDTYRQLINRLLSSVDPLPQLAGKVQSGGRLNLAAALGSTGNGPYNDDFAHSATLGGNTIQVRNSNVGATLETGETSTLAGAAVGASLWWSWTAPQAGTFYFDTLGSTYDTVLGVFTGSSVSGLTLVAANDDAVAGTAASHLAINAAAGTTYRIEVAGKNGATGTTALRIVAPPPNDNFSSAQALVGDPVNGAVAQRGVTLYATPEAAETNSARVGGGHTVWYTWTAPVSGRYQLSAYSTTLDMVSAVYTGAALADLTLLGADNNESGNNADSLVTFTAAAGQTYHFQIDNTGTTGGNFTVTVNAAAWQFPTGYGLTGSPAVGGDGTLYIGSLDGSIYAVNPDGTPRWSFASGGYFDNSSPALAANGTVVIGGSDGVVYALNAATGVLAWKFQAASAVATSVAVGADGSLYFHDDLNLYALSATGVLEWQATVNGHSFASPVVGTNGTIYVGTPLGLDLFSAAGTMLTSLATAAPIDDSPAIDADGTVYFGDAAGNAYALHPDGSVKWKVALGLGDGFSSSPVITPQGAICLASGFGSLYELSATDGSTLSDIKLPDETSLGAPVVAGDGTVYVATNDFNVNAVDPISHHVQVVAATPSYILGSAVLANGYLYFGSFDGKLYAFNVGKYPALTPWPMAHQNPGLTGRAVGGVTITSSSPSSGLVAGFPLTLSVTASGGLAGGPYQPVSYQWTRNGVPIAGATAPTYRVAAASPADGGTYQLTITSPAGMVASAPLAVSVAGADPGRLVNLSARSQVGTGDNVMIAGFVISGTGTKNVLVRGIGPTLGQFGVAGFLSTPQLNVDSGTQTLFSDTAWGGGATLAHAFTQVGAFPLAATSADSALVDSFAAGPYTALVSGTAGTGVALAEVYDADPAGTGTRLKNLSVRAQVGTGGSVLIAGFVISGNVPKTVLIRGIGPALNGFGVSGALQQPVLTLYTSNSVLIQTDYFWGGEPALANAMAAVGAFSLDPNSYDTAMLVTLPPGAYTAQVAGANGTTGVGLIEVYEVP